MRTIHRDIVGAFIFSSDDKILLGKSTTGVYEGQWVVPGGGIESDETRLDALRREVIEETGIDLTMGHVEGLSSKNTGESKKKLRDNGEQVHVKMTFFDYKINLPLTAAKFKLYATDDFTDAAWFTKEEAKKLDLAPSVALTLHKIDFLD